jgi:hypothetical protein
MGRPQKDPLRPLSQEERKRLEQYSRCLTLPADHVIHAKEVLAVANGRTFTDAARLAGRKSGDAVAHLIARFNAQGLPALETCHGGGPPFRYAAVECERILREFRRPPDRRLDGTATGSLVTLQRALRRASDGLPRVSTHTIGCVLHEAGYTWQQDRTWCKTGTALRVRKSGTVEVTDPDACAKKKLIEEAYTVAEQEGLPGWTQDKAGPYQTIPYPGRHWQPEGEPAQQPHEYAKNGTAKLLTLFHPATGKVCVKGVTTCPNTVLHGWLQEKLTQILASLPAPAELSPEENCARWQRWQEGLQLAPGIGNDMPPLRLLLVWDNLSGHHTPSFVRWLCEQRIMPLSTPLGGSWLNMSESIQRILVYAVPRCQDKNRSKIRENLTI